MAKHQDDDDDQKTAAEGQVIDLGDEESEKGKAKGGKSGGDEGDDAEDGGDGEAERVAAAEKAEKERAARREARRKEKHERRQHNKDARARDAERIAHLEGVVTELKNGQTKIAESATSATIANGLAEADRRIRECDDAIEAAERALEQAVKDQDGAKVREANKILREADKAKDRLLAWKEQAKAAGEKRPNGAGGDGAAAAPKLDPRAATKATAFFTRYPAILTEMRSNTKLGAKLRALDNLVAADHDGGSDDYYEAFIDHVSDVAPELLGDDDGDDDEDRQPARKRARGPALGNGRQLGGNLGKNEVFLPTGMIDALKEKGWWADGKPVGQGINVARRFKERAEADKKGARQ